MDFNYLHNLCSDLKGVNHRLMLLQSRLYGPSPEKDQDTAGSQLAIPVGLLGEYRVITAVLSDSISEIQGRLTVLEEGLMENAANTIGAASAYPR